MSKKSETPSGLPILWKDRKRHLGLPLSFTVYSMDENRFYLKSGFFNTSFDELLLYRILDIKLTRSLGQKIFGVGTITLMTADQSNPDLLIRNIKHSEATRRLISDKVEEQRDKKRIMGKEMFGAAGMEMLDDSGMNVGVHN